MSMGRIGEHALALLVTRNTEVVRSVLACTYTHIASKSGKEASITRSSLAQGNSAICHSKSGLIQAGRQVQGRSLSTLLYKCPASGPVVPGSTAMQPCCLALVSDLGSRARRHNAAPRRLYDKAMHQLMQKDDQQIVVMTQVRRVDGGVTRLDSKMDGRQQRHGMVPSAEGRV